jgi:hypothetical protein
MGPGPVCVPAQAPSVVWVERVLPFTLVKEFNVNSGIVTKGFKKSLEAIRGKHSTDSLKKTAILGTLHKILKVLQSET